MVGEGGTVVLVGVMEVAKGVGEPSGSMTVGVTNTDVLVGSAVGGTGLVVL